MIAAPIAKMGEATFSDAYEEGKKISLDEAVTYALGDGSVTKKDNHMLFASLITIEVQRELWIL